MLRRSCKMASKKDIFLANSLYDCLEDNDLRNIKIMLEDKAADPNTILPQQGISPFHFIIGNESASFADEVTRLFLQYGGDPNLKSVEGMTPVHVAAAWGRSNLLHLLLVNGGNPWIHDAYDKNAFHYAFEEKHWDVVQLLHRFRLMDLASNDKLGNLKYKLSLEKVIVSSGDVCVEYGIRSQSVDYSLNSGVQRDIGAVGLFYKLCELQGKGTGASTISGNSDGVSASIIQMEQESNKGSSRNRRGIISKRNLIDDFENGLIVINDRLGVSKDTTSDGALIVQNKKYGVHRSVDMFSSEVLSVPQNRSQKHMNHEGNTVVYNGEEVNCRRCLFPPQQHSGHNSREEYNQISESTTDTGDACASIDNLHSTNGEFEENQSRQEDIGCQQLLTEFTEKSDLNLESEWDCESRFWEWLASQSCYLRTVNSESSSSYCTCNEASESGNLVQVQSTEKEVSTLHGLDDKVKDRSLSSLSSCPLSSGSSCETYISEEYKYTDEEKGVVLLERRFLVNGTDVSGFLETDGSLTSSITSTGNTDAYDTETLRGELKAIGYTPGPITATTKRVYRRQLIRNRKNPLQPACGNVCVYSCELQRTLKNVEWQSNLSSVMNLEQEVANQFANPDPKRRWREGIIKSSFTYLLLDPRITDNLPNRVGGLSPLHTWSTFLSSVFYIGKGKRSRPYSHLYQAVAVWNKDSTVSIDKKVQHILDIWKSGLGVVCLHVFQNVIPAEAYTREAAMIDAMGLQNLTNNRHSEYYGKAATWTSRAKKQLGVYLLYRSLLIFLSEGERQLRPGDIG